MNHLRMLRGRIDEKVAVVGVIGLGYVGLPLLAAFCRSGVSVIGFDIDPRKIESLQRGQSYLKHLGASLIEDLPASGRFAVTTAMSRLGECDAIISCVPTPLGPHLEPDLSYVRKTAEDTAATLRQGQLFVLESSTYPGTTRQIVLPILQRSGLKCGEDFFLAYSPEREDPGRQDYSTQTIPKLVGGIDPPSTACRRPRSTAWQSSK